MESFEEHLRNLWTEGTRDIAVAFLQRAIGPNSSLLELNAALAFDGVQPYLHTIRLSDVLGARAATAAPQGAKSTGLPATLATPRKRRSADEMHQMRQGIIGLLSESPESLNTTQIVTDLAKRGHDIDAVRANLLLKNLQKEGKVRDLGGRPKAWRLHKSRP